MAVEDSAVMAAVMAVDLEAAVMAVDLEAAAAVEPPRGCKPRRAPCHCRSRSIQQRDVPRHLKLETETPALSSLASPYRAVPTRDHAGSNAASY